MANNFLEISKKIIAMVEKYNAYKLPDPVTSLTSSDINAFASSALGYELKLYIDRLKQKGNLENIGIAGPQGDMGPKGPIGDVGDMGPQGPRGDKGPKGRDGKDGKDGKPGANGEDGSSGGFDSTSAPALILNGNGGSGRYMVYPYTYVSLNVAFNKWYTTYTDMPIHFCMMQPHLYGGDTDKYSHYLDITTSIWCDGNTNYSYYIAQVGRKSFGKLPSMTMRLNSLRIISAR